MRTIAVAVAILCACFMQEVSGELLSTTPVTHLTEKKVEKSAEEVEAEEQSSADIKALEELEDVREKLNAKAEELYAVAQQNGATDEAKKAADQAGKESQAARAKLIAFMDEEEEMGEQGEIAMEKDEKDGGRRMQNLEEDSEDA